MRSLGELRKAPRGKPVTAAARNVRKPGGLAERLKNHPVGADGACPDHWRSLRRPFSESYRGTLDDLYFHPPSLMPSLRTGTGTGAGTGPGAGSGTGCPVPVGAGPLSLYS